MVTLMALAPLSGCLGIIGDGDSDDGGYKWIDPVTEVEDANHSHNDLLAHRLSTPNARPVSYTHLTLPTKA